MTGGEAQPRLDGVTAFFDRDGTLNPDPGYIARPEDFELLPGAGAALRRLNVAGARVIVVTNQSGIARGKFKPADLERIHQKLLQLLAHDGARIDAIYHCPHHPEDNCACRKPAVGMVERAIADFGLDRSRMYVIGDHERDIEMATRLGARSILVTTGNGSFDALRALYENGFLPDFVAKDLDTAVNWIFLDTHASPV